MKNVGNVVGMMVLSFLMVVGIAFIATGASVTQLSGLAVAQSLTQWNQLKDMAFGDAVSNGSGLVTPCLWNGSSCDRQRGSIANGALVDVTRFPVSGTNSFSVQRVNITTASVNLAFGFTSKKVAIRVSPNNTDDICIDWLGGTAVCPAANTAGDGRLAPGTTFILDDYAVTSLSVIANSGTQQVNINAWN